MLCCRMSKRTFVMAELVTALLFAILARPLVAQRANEPVPARGLALANPTHELAFDGTVQEVVSQRANSSPPGVHVIVSGSARTVDAHLGPFLTQDTREALHMGLPIHVVGDMKEFHGRQILLARLISFGGRTVVVRNTHGALIQYPRHAQAVTVQPANGGSR